MEPWVRWAVGVTAFTAIVALSVVVEKPVARTLVRAARRSPWRGVVVVIAFYALWLLAVGLVTIPLVALDRAGQDLAVLIGTGVAGAVLVPPTVVLMPGDVPVAGHATGATTLGRAGASGRVAAAMGWTGAILWFVTVPGVLVAAFVFGIAGYR